MWNDIDHQPEDLHCVVVDTGHRAEKNICMDMLWTSGDPGGFQNNKSHVHRMETRIAIRGETLPYF